jgi:hypothetical protein
MCRGGHYSRRSDLASGRAGRSCGNNGGRLLAPGSRFGFGSVHLLSVVAHAVRHFAAVAADKSSLWVHSANPAFARHSEYRPARRTVIGVAAHVTTPLRSLVTWAAACDTGCPQLPSAGYYTVINMPPTTNTTTTRPLRTAGSCRPPGISLPASSGSQVAIAGSHRPPARLPTRR